MFFIFGKGGPSGPVRPGQDIFMSYSEFEEEATDGTDFTDGTGALRRFHAGEARPTDIDQSLVTSSTTSRLNGRVAVRRSLSHSVAMRRIRRRPADGTLARQGGFFARIPGFQTGIGFERRENSRLFPPFPPLTAF
jgi:hypothetical protein